MSDQFPRYNSTLPTYLGDHAVTAREQRDHALAERDRARDLATTYEAELAATAHLVASARKYAETVRDYREAHSNPGRMHEAAMLYASRGVVASELAAAALALGPDLLLVGPQTERH